MRHVLWNAWASRERRAEKIERSKMRIVLTLLVLLSLSVGASGQIAQATIPATSPGDAREEEARKWSFSAAIYTYSVPDQHDYVQPTITADHDWLHLEARYNYEALDSGSIWV